MPDSAHYRDALAPLFVQEHPDWVVAARPSVPLAHPHVAAGLIEVDDVLAELHPSCKLHSKVPDHTRLAFLGLAKLVLDDPILDLVLVVEVAESARPNLDAQVPDFLDLLGQRKTGPFV